ncbi:MAG: hypothetical protein KDN19_00540 [Verrucomicrobiae bacterium]|nr:hypothetical protein [Verrucomicrobiae bacterium]
MLKTIVSVFLVLGLMSPLCLCGAAVNDAHTPVTKAGASCHADHSAPDHEHQRDEAPEPGHFHSHTDMRQAAPNPVSLPPIPPAGLADWALWISAPKLEVVAMPSFLDHVVFDPVLLRRTRPVVTGVFRL